MSHLGIGIIGGEKCDRLGRCMTRVRISFRPGSWPKSTTSVSILSRGNAVNVPNRSITKAIHGIYSQRVCVCARLLLDPLIELRMRL